MNIELDIPNGAIKEWVISHTREKLTELHKGNEPPDDLTSTVKVVQFVYMKLFVLWLS